MYCQLEDIQKQVYQDTLIQLTDDNQTGEINPDVIDEAIMYSSILIDGYLRGRYILPLSQTPAIISIIAVDLCIFRLYSRRFDTNMPETVKEKYAHSIKMLEQIQKGKLLLGIEPTEIPMEAREYQTNKDFRKKIFPRCRLNEY